MKVLIACDKFKGSLDAYSVCKVIASGLESSQLNVECKQQPLADGGDGTIDILRRIHEFDRVAVETIDPLGRPIVAAYYTKEKVAYVELAEASGIARLKKSELDVMATTTLGTGKLISHAIENGFNNIVLAIGGSCTNEMGLGIAYELGYRFLDKQGNELIPTGGNLSSIIDIIFPERLLPINIKILCDVENPLYGPQGAAQIYGPQKGASQEDIKELDKGVRHIAEIISSRYNKEVVTMSGAGAAGGIAAGLFGLLPDVSVESGFEYLAQVISLEDKIIGADLIISGEGGLEDNSFDGKVIGKVYQLCREHNKSLILVVGNNRLSAEKVDQLNEVLVYDILSRAGSIDDAIANPKKYLENITSELAANLL